MKRTTRLLAITATVFSLLETGHVQAQAHRKRTARTRPSAQATPAKPTEAAQPEAEASAASDAEVNAPAAEPKTAEAVDAAPPTPTSSAPAAHKPGEKGGDSAALQQELAALMDDLVQTRERVAVIGKALFKTRVRVKLENRADEQVAGRITLRLDGAPIFSADGSSLRDAERPLFDGFAAPGPHVLELEIEQRARNDEGYRYNQRQSFRFEVVRDLRTDLRLVLDDDSDIADDFADDREGEYDVRTRLQVRAVPLNEE